MLLALCCRHCGSRYVQIERPVWDYQDHPTFSNSGHLSLCRL